MNERLQSTDIYDPELGEDAQHQTADHTFDIQRAFMYWEQEARGLNG